MIPPRAWHRMRTGSGTKGTRHYDWAMLEVAGDDTPAGRADGYSELLAPAAPLTGRLSYYRCWTPGPVPLSRLIAIAVARWRIEEDHQLTKQSAGHPLEILAPLDRDLPAGLFFTLYIYLAIAVAVQRQQEAGSGLDAGLIPITVPELLRLLGDTVIPRPGKTGLTGCTGPPGAAVTSGARQAHQRWNAYAGTTP